MGLCFFGFFVPVGNEIGICPGRSKGIPKFYQSSREDSLEKTRKLSHVVLFQKYTKITLDTERFHQYNFIDIK